MGRFRGHQRVRRRLVDQRRGGRHGLVHAAQLVGLDLRFLERRFVTLNTSTPDRTASRDWTLWSTTARLVVTDPTQIALVGTLADALIADVDRDVSRFRADSELQLAAGLLHQGVEVSNTLADLVRQALASAALTDGDVDPTLGYALDAVGYDRDIRLIEDRGVPVRAIVSRRHAPRRLDPRAPGVPRTVS